MPTPIDDHGAYRVVLPFDMSRRLGISLLGAQELSAARPLSMPADRQRLAELVAAAGPLPARQWLSRQGVSAGGADQLVRGLVVTDASDRQRIAHALEAVAGNRTRTTALEVYDYPGEYAQRFDGVGRG
jgi:hypothetical protein